MASHIVGVVYCAIPHVAVACKLRFDESSA